MREFITVLTLLVVVSLWAIPHSLGAQYMQSMPVIYLPLTLITVLEGVLVYNLLSMNNK